MNVIYFMELKFVIGWDTFKFYEIYSFINKRI